MSRGRAVASLIPQLQNGKRNVENKPASDKTKLVWNEIMGPLNNAANALNVVINQTTERIVREAAKRDGVDINRFALNVDTMEWQPRPMEQKRDAATGDTRT